MENTRRQIVHLFGKKNLVFLVNYANSDIVAKKATACYAVHVQHKCLQET